MCCASKFMCVCVHLRPLPLNCSLLILLAICEQSLPAAAAAAAAAGWLDGWL